MKGDRRGVVIVFGKAPQPGLVKTRMTPPLTPEQAAELYRRLLEDVLEATAAFAEALGIDAVLALHPGEACAQIAAGVPPVVRVIEQRGSNLSERMTLAVDEAAAGGARRILLRGSDGPLLSEAEVALALDSLDRNDLVVCPDLDGGYGMIGVRAPIPGLFDHPMSTGTVLEETLANARRLGLRCLVLAPSFDLDTVTDLHHLERARARGAAALCPRTLAYLDAESLWDFAPHERSES